MLLSQSQDAAVPVVRLLLPRPALLVVAAHVVLLWLISHGAVPAVPVASPAPAVLVALLSGRALPASPPRHVAPMHKAQALPLPVAVPQQVVPAVPEGRQDSVVAPAPDSHATAEAPAQAQTVLAPQPQSHAQPEMPPLISSGVAYVRAPQPQYPAAAKRRGDQGEVLFRVLINTDGMVEQVTLQRSSGVASLDEAGRQAILQAAFKPYLEQGKARAAYVLVPIKFQLQV
jgi:protein TonB